MGVFNTVCFAILQLFAICSCAYGLYVLASIKPFSVFSVILYGLWFILGFASNLCAIIASYYKFMNSEDDKPEEDGKNSGASSAQFFIQYHYLLAWLTVVIGYPGIVIQSWMIHYSNNLAKFHFLLMLPPLVSWIRKKPSEIVLTTQVTGFVGVASHLYIEYLSGDLYGILGSLLMIFNLVAIAVPTRHSVLGFTARELYLATLAITSYAFSLNIESSAKNPVRVTNLAPWIK